MSSSGTKRGGGGRKRIVAERRYAKPGASKPKPTRKTVAKTARKPARKPNRRRTTRKSNKKRGPVRRILAWLWRPFGWLSRIALRLAWRGALIMAVIVAIAVGWEAATLPSEYTELVDQRARGSVTLLDNEGRVFAWRGDQFGGIITVDTASEHLHNAVIATEDQRFYRHLGVSPRGVASAIRINLSAGRSPLSGNGGSTITQQTAKLLCLGVPFDPETWENERAYEADCRQGSLWRKIKEAVYALALEARYSKEEILTIYFNRAYLGAGARGFEAAAQRYFGKSAAEVNPAEAALMAGLLKAPSRYDPTNNLQRSRDRAQVVMNLMTEQDYLSEEERLHWRANPASLSAAAEARAGGYFADWIMRSGPEFFTRNTTEDVVIRSTLDQRLQTAAEEALLHVFENKVREGSEAQAAIVVMSADGAVRAMVGGTDVRASGALNRAIQAQRQTGSSFKPFVYAAALELGYTPNDLVEDKELCMNIPGSGRWCPRNYDGQFYGTVTLTEALQRSLNTAAVRVSEAAGRDNVRKIASDFGIESNLADGPALALGASESNLLEMTGAFAGILNGGSAVKPYGLIELTLQGESDPVMTQDGGIGERVISNLAAEQLVYMMSRVVEDGTGRRARLPGRQAAGKTGTTSAAKDAWFIGFTADYVAGVWMGYDDNTPLSGVTGGGLPAEIWHEVMVRVHEGLPARPLPMADPGPARPSVAQEQADRQRRREERRQRRRNTNGAIENLLLELFGRRN